MRRYVIAAAVLLLSVAPSSAGDFWDQLVPDAGLYAQTLSERSHGVEAVSWELVTSDRVPLLAWTGARRLWADVLKPIDRPGLALSVDITPQNAACFGGGYQGDSGWLVFVGVHVR